MKSEKKSGIYISSNRLYILFIVIAILLITLLLGSLLIYYFENRIFDPVVGLTFILIIISFFTVVISRESVEEMKKSREQENAPYVVFYFDYHVSSHEIYIIIQNIGKSTANIVNIEFNPKLINSYDRNISESSLLANGISQIPPNSFYSSSLRNSFF